MNARGFSRVEAMRLAALRKLEILDTAPEVAFDRLVSMAASVLDAPMAILSFIDKDRQWLKASRGFEQIESPRELSFCTHAIDEAGLCEILDATKDPRFSANPFVVGPPRLRYYAGARLLTRQGYPLGMLAVLDDRVRPPLSQDQCAFLQGLAAIAMDELELRSARDIAEKALRTESRFLAHMSHELRTPLNGVLGMNALLLGGDLSPDQRNMAETMQESGRALLEMIGDILDASKLHHDRPGERPKLISTPDLMERSDADPCAIQQQPVPGLAASEGVRVLLAEDDSTSARVAISLLTSAGGDVLHVPDGQEAVERAAAERFDVIVLDIRMPRLNGIAAGTRIRQHPGPNQRIPIYAVTAEATAEARAQALACGFTDFITKPYRPEILRALVNQTQVHCAAGGLLDEAHIQLLEEVMSAPELRELFDLWSGEVRDQLDHIEAALHNPEALAAGVHKLKGAASSFGAVRIAAVAAELKANPTPARIEALRNALAATCDELRKRIAN